MKREAYVYAITVNGVVRYIGKGTGDRASRHIQVAKKLNRGLGGKRIRRSYFYRKLAAALKRGKTVSYRILRKGLTDKQAFRVEVEQIARMSGLWNLTAGGEGWLWADPNFREKQRRAASKCLAKLWRDPKFRKRGSAAIIQRNRKWWADPAYRERQREKMKAQMVRQLRDPEFRRKQHTPADIRRFRAASKQRWKDPEYRRRVSEAVAASNRRRAQND